jgi:cell division protein ZapB
METELKSLEQKLNQFVELCQRLRTDNQQLRQELASALSDNKQLSEKIGTASDRLENLLQLLPEDEA